MTYNKSVYRSIWFVFLLFEEKKGIRRMNAGLDLFSENVTINH